MQFSYSRSGLCVLAWLIIACISSLSDNALAFSPAVPPEKYLPEWASNRLFWCSADAPMTKHLDKNAAFVAATKVIVDHLTMAEDAIRDVLVRKKKPAVNDPFKPCNYGLKGWISSTDGFFMQRRWPLPDSSCVTEIIGARTSPDEEPKYSVDELYDAVYTRGAILKSEAKTLAEITVGKDNFTSPDTNFNGVFTRLNQRCLIHPIGGVRLNGGWNLVTGVQSVNIHNSVPRGGRHAIVEHHGVGQDGKLSKPLEMTLNRTVKEDRNESFPGRSPKKGTTGLITGGGSVTPSHFAPVYPEDNPAVIDALIEIDFHIQQAEDALSPASVAILMLPLFLNLVPIALLAEVSTTTMFVYTMLSDVLTVVPLTIKGCELIYIGRHKVRSAATRMSSTLKEERPEAAVANFWVVECGVEGRSVQNGITFIVLSMVFLVIGVAGEFAAKEYVRKKRTRLLNSLVDQIPLFKRNGRVKYNKSSLDSLSTTTRDYDSQPVSFEFELELLKAS